MEFAKNIKRFFSRFCDTSIDVIGEEYATEAKCIKECFRRYFGTDAKLTYESYSYGHGAYSIHYRYIPKHYEIKVEYERGYCNILVKTQKDAGRAWEQDVVWKSMEMVGVTTDFSYLQNPELYLENIIRELASKIQKSELKF